MKVRNFEKEQREAQARAMRIDAEVTRALLELRIRIIDRIGVDPGSLEHIYEAQRFSGKVQLAVTEAAPIVIEEEVE
jgi:hypothetical protein